MDSTLLMWLASYSVLESPSVSLILYSPSLLGLPTSLYLRLSISVLTWRLLGVRRSWPALSMAHLPLFRQFSTTGGRSTWASLTQLVFATCLYLVFLAYPLVPGLPRASTKKYAAGHLRTILVFVLFSRPRLDYCRRCINGFLHSPFVTS